jgi:hypothetical protein
VTEVRVTWAERGHLPAIAADMRLADRREVQASSGLDPLSSLRWSLDNSALAWTGWVDGEPVAIWGVASVGLLSTQGAPWLLGTTALERHQIPFLRRNKAFIACMRAQFATLANHVDNRNTLSMRWLRWLGFEIEEPKPYGVLQLPFRRFTMKGLLDV